MPALPTIEAIRNNVTAAVCDNAKVKRAFLFGSFARGEAKDASDIDISLDTEKGFGLIDACDVRLDLSPQLGRSVDVTAVPTKRNAALYPEFERDKVLLYEREGAVDTDLYIEPLRCRNVAH
ncbi:MAG: nucleotidyltransferase domain-containing protein [Coriobacteriales bacterium]|jgi:predicted nucleotidyltransferase|nr:nucleotidyltransferase domain-containing protein [Coriobacteriales bacterium]